jgi:hypothetical protein
MVTVTKKSSTKLMPLKTNHLPEKTPEPNSITETRSMTHKNCLALHGIEKNNGLLRTNIPQESNDPLTAAL